MRRLVPLVLLTLLVPATSAFAQLSSQLSLLSDYRLRGVSLSDRDPALQASFNYDHSSGLFLGALVSSAKLVRSVPNPAATSHGGYPYAAEPSISVSSSGAAAQLSAGYAAPLAGTLSWDAGVTRYLLPKISGFPGYDYSEYFLGASSEFVTSHLYFTRDYYGRSVDMKYLEVNVSHPLSDRITLVGHVGWLSLAYRNATGDASSVRVDYKAGVALDLTGGTVIECSLVGVDLRDTSCPLGRNNCQSTALVSISHMF